MPGPAPGSRTQARPRVLFPIAWSRSCNHLRAMVGLRVYHLFTNSFSSIRTRSVIRRRLRRIKGGDLGRRRQTLCTTGRLYSAKQLLSNGEVALGPNGEIVVQEDWL